MWRYLPLSPVSEKTIPHQKKVRELRNLFLAWIVIYFIFQKNCTHKKILSPGDADSDGDGVKDSEDADDDNDGLLDVEDADDDGDGVEDEDEDLDGDGISNEGKL